MILAPTDASAPNIRLVNLTKRYGTPAAPVWALKNVSIEIHRGERVALLGKSGSGKSTLLNLLGGLDRPTEGQVIVAGRDLARLTQRELAQYRSAAVGMVFQSFNLISSRSAIENVELPMVFAGQPRRDRQASAREALHAVGLGQRLHHLPSALSGGESQRVAVARALVNQPELLLADEPTGNLDTATGRQIMELILDHMRQFNATLVLVTHDQQLAREYTTRIIRLQDGEVACD